VRGSDRRLQWQDSKGVFRHRRLTHRERLVSLGSILYELPH